jgi:predicted dinucleotide-binding enzyme
MKKQKLPPGWDEKRVREVIAHYEHQSEEEQAAEIEAALRDEDITMVAVPTELVPQVLALVKRRKRTA